MADDEIEKEPGNGSDVEKKASVPARRFFTLRKLLLTLGVSALAAITVLVVVFVLYRVGVFDRYIEDQLVAKLSDIGIAFDAETLRVTASPMTLEMHNATFRDKLSGDKLATVRDVHLRLTVLDLLSWRMSRDISIDSSEISGAEIWVKFDESGRSNFSNLKFVEDEKGSAVNFRYDSVNFSLRDSIVHFGDLARHVSADAKNLIFTLAPETAGAVNGRYAFGLNSTASTFKYEDKAIENIDLSAKGTAVNTGAEISNLTLRTPVGDATLAGTLTDWAAPKYELDIESTLDITQISNTFELATALRGVGNFKGHVSGSGETYNVTGTADSEALRAAGIYLKAVNVEGTVQGTNANYAANGKAVAEMLTFDDFQVDFPKITGNVRGTGTDFRWVGELQAIAAKSTGLTIGGLFLSDAVAEYKDRAFRASVGNGRTQRFAIGDTEFEDLRARELKLSLLNGGFDISAPSASTGVFATKDYRIGGVAGRNVSVKHTSGQTSIDAAGLTAQNATFGKNKVGGVTAAGLKLRDAKNKTSVELSGLTASRIDGGGATIGGVETPLATIENSGGRTVIYSDKLRIASIDTGSATLGSLNIGGVRLTIRQGTIEGTTDDVDAGNVTLAKTRQLPAGGELQWVVIKKPVFLVEPSGRYRASADMSIGGGMVGSVSLGSATAKVDLNNDRLSLDQLSAVVMDGTINGSATVAFNTRTQSHIDADFADLDLSKLAAMQSGRVMPLEGKATGNAHLELQGTNYRTTSGTVKINLTANAGTADRGLVPINGTLELAAKDGLFDVTTARLFTDKSELTAAGRFDLRSDDSNLDIALRSSDASEIKRIVDVTGISPDLEQQMASMQAEVAGELRFDGKVNGNLYDPTINGRASVENLLLHSRVAGRVSTDISVSPSGIDLKNGELLQPDGGKAEFAVNVPYGGSNNVTVTATLTGVNAGSLLAALPITLPGQISDLDGRTSGTVNITGLPNNAAGDVNLTATNGTIAGQSFDELLAKAVFRGTRIELESGTIRVGNGSITATGSYDRQNSAFSANLTGKSVPLPLLMSVIPKNDSMPAMNGVVDLTANAMGEGDHYSSYNVVFSGLSRQTRIGDSELGDVTFTGKTADRILTAQLVGNLDGRAQIIDATLHFDDDSLPFAVKTVFDQAPLGPYIAFIPQLKGLPVSGTGTGTIEFGGKLRAADSTGKYVFTTSGLAGSARFTFLGLSLQDTQLAALEPVSIRFDTREIYFENAKFGGGGSNMTISGNKGLVDDADNNLEIAGKVNLNLLNLAKTDVFFAGVADVNVRLNGPNITARLTGSASSENASIATFIGSDRLTFERVKTKVIFTSNQAEIEEASGYLGGGKFTGSGGVLLDGLSVRSFRFAVDGDNVTVPLPKDFLTTGDARLEMSGIRVGSANELQITISGRVFARRSLYTKDIELANIVGARHDTSLSNGSSSLTAPRFDLVIEGKNALIIRNNIADLTASVSLSLTGDADNPRLSGRITASSGTLLYRKDRYEVQRAVLEFPPETAIEPIINLQAETDIAGYQIFVNLSCALNDTERCSADVRSSPALPSNDVVSLITTGSLANTAGGLPTLAQTGINTAAEILTDSIINNPARKATDKLFGLNVFEIDPIIAGRQLNPSARLTVGRQINNNLRVTYSTNLSQDQNQVIALEYRVSNKLSVVAQYEQRSLSNVTRNRENFSMEIRFRKRF